MGPITQMPTFSSWMEMQPKKAATEGNVLDGNKGAGVDIKKNEDGSISLSKFQGPDTNVFGAGKDDFFVEKGENGEISLKKSTSKPLDIPDAKKGDTFVVEQGKNGELLLKKVTAQENADGTPGDSGWQRTQVKSSLGGLEHRMRDELQELAAGSKMERPLPV